MILKRNKKTPILLKKGVKIGLGIFSGILIVLYASFLIIPRLINLNNYTSLIEDELKKYTKFDFELVEPKLATTFDLAIKISAKKIALKYEDKKDFINLEDSFIKINLPTLIFGELNLDKIYVKNIDVNLVFDKNKTYTVEKYIIEQKNKENTTQQKETEQTAELPIKIKNINIVSDNIKLTLLDKVVSKTFILNAQDNNLHLSSLNGPLKFKTKGYLGTNQKHFVDFDINIQTPISIENSAPTQQQQNAEFKLPNINPLQEIDKFNFYAKANANLKINSFDNFKGKGNINISDITMLIKNVQLPKSYVNIELNGDKISNNAKFYVAKEEFIESNGTINLGKKTKLDINAKTEKISLNNIKTLLASTFDMFLIKNDLKNAQATGYLTCDFNIKSDGKKIKSSGESKIIDGSFKYPLMNINLEKISSLLDFSNDKLSIEDTSAILNGSKFSLNGEILTNSKLNISIDSDPIKISDIIKLGESLKIINANDFKDFAFKSGIIKIAIKLTGTIQNILPDAKILVDGTNILIKSLNMPINIANIEINAKPEGKVFKGNIEINQINSTYPNPKLTLNIPKISIPFDSQNLTINKTDINLDGTNIILDGTVKNYMTKPEVLINADGKIAPNTILGILPKDTRKLVKYQGQMPIKLGIKGKLPNIILDGKIISNSQNYISVIDINSIKGNENTLNYNISLEDDILNITDISINSKNNKIATIKGKLSSIYKTNPIINNISISIPQKIDILIAPLDNLKLSATGNINVSGTVKKPNVSGIFNVNNVDYPTFKLKVNSAKVDFKNNIISAVANAITLADSDFSGNMEISTDISKKITINSLNFKSNNTNTDSIFKILESMPQSEVAPGTETTEIEILKGKGEIANLKSGNLAIQNIDFDYSLKNNLFKIMNLKTNVYEGLATGNIDYNLAQLRANIDMQMQGINVGKFTNAMSGIVLPITGIAQGNAKLTFKGSTFKQQMQSINGSVDFNVRNGEIKELIKFENFLKAGNILSQNILGFNLNSAISAVSGKNTGNFDTLNGLITFANGYANIQTFKTRGNQMSLNVTGKYNLLTNYIDAKILGRISTGVVNVLGPLGNYSVSKIIDDVASKNQTVNTILNIAKAIAPTNPLFQTATESEIAQIPELTNNGENKQFMVILQGLITKTTTVKSFKWIDSQ
ncbi:MAG: AsmA family protein [Cyanobacteria bacterium SIG30]|nr:AsmA family protein [Cyanobacteria bacterium SIG30]